MTVSAIPTPALAPLERLRRQAPALFGTSVVLTVLLAVFLTAGAFDTRTFNGVPIWGKPAKFAFALTVYCLTLTFYAAFVPDAVRNSRWWRIMIGATVFSIAAEMVWIGGAAALGTGSHFNVSTGLSAAIYGLMGVFATVLTAASAFFAFAIARNSESGLTDSVKAGLVWGLALTLPLTLITAGTMSAMGSHWIGGTPTDLGGLPFFGWSRDGGDLRVAHFFATHAMHVVPVMALAAAAAGLVWKRLPVLLALLYTLFVLAVFAQALSGQAFLALA